MASLECKSCGNVLRESDLRCPYCGATNSGYKSKEESYSQPRPQPTVINNYNTSSESDSSGINVCILIILIIVFWPAAIIYAVVKMKK